MKTHIANMNDRKEKAEAANRLKPQLPHVETSVQIVATPVALLEHRDRSQRGRDAYHHRLLCVDFLKVLVAAYILVLVLFLSTTSSLEDS